MEGNPIMKTKDFSSINNPAKAILTGNHEVIHNKNNSESNSLKSYPTKKNPEFLETKSKRVQMLMQPSLYDEIKDIAHQCQLSINETMHEILKSYVENSKL